MSIKVVILYFTGVVLSINIVILYFTGVVLSIKIVILYFTGVVIPPANKVWEVYKNHPVRLSVRPSMYLVSATPPKRLIGVL